MKMVIGITGSFGSGKTEIAKMFGMLGCRIIDADKICHSLIKPPAEVYKKIIKHFGREVLAKNKAIDRKKLGEIVFKEKSKLWLLNKIIHPYAIREIQKVIRKEKKSRVIIVDAPLLVETKFHKRLDKLIVIKMRKDKQVRRIIRAKGMTKREILDRIEKQAPLKKKLALADFIIDNNGSKKETLIQVRKIWKTLRGELCQ